MLALLAAHIEVVTYARVNKTPLSASLSIAGVLTMGCPVHDRTSLRWSSIRKNKMFGLVLWSTPVLLQE